MGKQKWSRIKSCYVIMLCVAAAITAVTVVIAEYIVINGNKQKTE